MNDKMYTAALIGTGRIGFTLGFDKKREQPASHTMALLANKKIRLIAAADTNQENLECWEKFVKGKFVREAKTFSTSEELYKAFTKIPDIITVAVNEDSHLEECLKAIKARPRLIILEKPVALNSKEAEKIRLAAEENQVPVMVNHERRFAADYNTAKAYIKKIGTLQSIRGELYSGLRIYAPEFEKDGSYSLLHDGTHLVDIIRFLLDEDLENPIVCGLYKDDKDAVRNFSAHYSTKSCPDISLYMSGRSRFFSFGLDILGTEGRICLGNGYAKFYQRKESKLYTGFYSLSRDHSIHLPKKTGYFANMVQNAVDFLDETAPLKSPLSEAIADLRVLEEIKAKLQ
ncbi:MAG: Gfo/Idh/MocA family oxidoreductase [Treponema sp.]|nr:Gfo/Idh/MocA family oxidoreductase [Treponema sp.]